MVLDGRRLAQTAGRSGLPKSAQRKSERSCTQRTPAGLPPAMPGIGDEIDGAIQHAPQPERQSVGAGIVGGGFIGVHRGFGALFACKAQRQNTA